MKLLPKWKESHAWLKDIDSQALQQSILHLGNSFKNFFQKRSRLPKFKNKHGKQAISYPQRVKIDGKIYLPKIGWVKVVLHREVIGKIKTVTISRSVTGKYYVSVLMETEDTIPNPIKHLEKVTGIDVGLTNFLTDSKGNTIGNPRFLKCKKIEDLQNPYWMQVGEAFSTNLNINSLDKENILSKLGDI